LEAEVAIVKRCGINRILAKPETFMNDSGRSVRKICQFFKIQSSEVAVICDDISFDLGKFKLTVRSGSAGHNGIIDILEKIGHGFARLRVGVGAKKHRAMDLKDHVLGKFTDGELAVIESIIPEILIDLQLLLDKGLECSIDLTNRRKFYEGQKELQG
jgi:PTH1 family peptidyl-tRNA hydrolase